MSLSYLFIAAERNNRLQSQGDQRAKQHSKVVCQTAMCKAVKRYSGNLLFTTLRILPFNWSFLSMFSTALFCLVAFFILHAVRLNLFFSAFHYRACLPSLHVSLLVGVCQISKSSLYSLPFFYWHKNATTGFDPLQRGRYVVINTHWVYMKAQTYPGRLYWLICHSLYGINS